MLVKWSSLIGPPIDVKKRADWLIRSSALVTVGHSTRLHSEDLNSEISGKTKIVVLPAKPKKREI